MIDGSLKETLLGGSKDKTDVRRLNQIYDTTFSRQPRTSIYSHVESALTVAFTEELISENPGLMEKAYVSTPDRVQFDERIKMYVQKRDHVLAPSPIKVMPKGGMQEATKKITETPLKVRPIALLTLGLVGSGKTTFLNYVNKVMPVSSSVMPKATSRVTGFMLIFVPFHRVDLPGHLSSKPLLTMPPHTNFSKTTTAA